MIKKSVLIIEDDKIQLEAIKNLVAEVDPELVVYTAASAPEAYRLLVERTIDVFLVDIMLSGDRPSSAEGFDLVERVRKMPKYLFTPVVFITSLDDTTGYAYKDLNCLGYVEKPFSPERVKRLVEKALCFPRLERQGNTFCFRRDGIVFPVKVEDIVYMDTCNHLLSVFTAKGDVLEVPYRTLKDVLHEMDADCMMQCSRRTVVNKDYIVNMDLTNRFITLRGVPEKIEIGKVYKNRVMLEYGL